MHYILTEFYDSGKVKAKYLSEQEVKEKGYYNGYRAELKNKDIYIDGFNTAAQADQFLSEAINS